MIIIKFFVFFFSSRRRHTRYWRDWSSDVCSSDLETGALGGGGHVGPSSGCRAAVPAAFHGGADVSCARARWYLRASVAGPARAPDGGATRRPAWPRRRGRPRTRGAGGGGGSSQALG